MTAVAAMIGGGAGLKLIEWFRARGDARAVVKGKEMAAESDMRGELWKEIGVLRGTLSEADKKHGERANRMAAKIEEMVREINALTVALYGWRRLATALKLRIVDLMGQVNQRDVEAGRTPSYNLPLEEQRLADATKELGPSPGPTRTADVGA